MLAVTVTFTGLLRCEVLPLRREDCDLDRATIRVRRREEMYCSSAPPCVDVQEDLRLVLAQWRARNAAAEWVFPNKTGKGHWAGGPAGTKPVEQLAKAGRAVGVAGFTFNELHRFFLEHRTMSVDYEAGAELQPRRRRPRNSPGDGGNGRARALTNDDATRLMAHLLRGSATWEGHRLYALVGVALFTGLRLAQVQGLRVQDCDLEGRTLRIYRGPIPHLLLRKGSRSSPVGSPARTWAGRSGCSPGPRSSAPGGGADRATSP